MNSSDRATLKSPDEVYVHLWKDTVENPDGTLNKQAVIDVLYNYSATLYNNSLLYSYLTEGEVTDPQTPITVVMEISDLHVASMIDGGIQDVIHLISIESKDIEDDSDRLRLIEERFESILTKKL